MQLSANSIYACVVESQRTENSSCLLSPVFPTICIKSIIKKKSFLYSGYIAVKVTDMQTILADHSMIFPSKSEILKKTKSSNTRSLYNNEGC